MTIGEWLKTIGMEQYILVFENNHLSFDNLESVTEADLESIGIPLGHRKNIFKEFQLLQSRTTLTTAENQGRIAKKKVRKFTNTMLIISLLGGGIIGYAFRETDGTIGIDVTLGILGGAMVCMCGYFYMLPTLLAFERQNKFRWAIAIGNIFAGVTVVGWVILLFLGLQKINGGQAAVLAVVTDSTS